MTELRSAVGRAELVRLLARGGSNEAASMAALLGFSPPALTIELPAIGELAGAEEAPATAAVPPLPVQGEKLKFKPIPFLRVGRVEYNDNEGPPPATPVPKLDLDPPRTCRELPVSPLVAWPRLWRVLEDVLRSLREGERLDVPRLVGEIARGQVIRRLPRQWVAGTGRVRLVLDRSRHLVPFWSDQRLLELELRWRLGPHSLEVRYIGHAGPMELLAERETEGLQLVASDLGFLGTPETRATWKRLGEKWKGEGARLRALVPCPPGCWEQDLAKLWNATEWENPKIEANAETPLSAEERVKKLEALQKLVAPLVRVEPGLLRELRQLLGRAADAGTEADLWALFPNPSTVAATPPPTVAEWRQKLISEGLAPDLQRRVFEVIRHWHWQLPPLILAEELGIHAPAGAEAEQERYLDFLRAACAEIETRGSEAARVAAWFERWNGRMTNMPADEALVIALIGAWRRLAKEGEAPELPEWASPALRAALEPVGELRKFEIRQRGNEIVLGERAEGSPIGEIRSSGPTIQVGGAQSRLPLLKTADRGLAFELEDLPPKLRIVSNLEAVELRTETRPAWASAAGRDQYGLWADLEVGGVVQRMRYIRPGRFLMGSPETEEGRYADEGPQHQVTLTEGFWLADTPCTQDLWQMVMGKNPSRFKGPKRPVEQVSWDDVQLFLTKLGKGLTGGAIVAQLPTEMQWEYACRAGTQTRTYVGEAEADCQEIAWFSANSDGETRDVGQKRANPWGLFDTLGNVLEWCANNWAERPGSLRFMDHRLLTGFFKAYRGGSWFDVSRIVRAAYRNSYGRGFRNSSLGFRFALFTQGTVQVEKPRAEVFFSSAWRDDEGPESRQWLKAADLLKDFAIHRDWSAPQLGEFFAADIDKSSSVRFFVVIVSDEYLRSLSCMFDLYRLYQACWVRKPQLLEQVFAVMRSDVKIARLVDRVQYLEYWNGEAERYELMLQDSQLQLSEASLREYHNLRDFINHVDEILVFVSDVLLLRNVGDLSAACAALRRNLDLAEHSLLTGLAPDWATAWGEDRYGVFAVLRVGSVEQKLRYIPPGSFLMGSPETEQGRWEDEGPQHFVTLTEGYWLADTPCTQEFWQEVMSNNPSRFQSPRRPVEQIRWDDVQAFLRRLEERFPGLEADLPTEAQWEYACRAGTTTSTYAGELKILGASNAPLLDQIAWYGGNSGEGFELEEGFDSTDWSEKQYPHKKAGTREVGQKRPNAWGLYDMLGNVWEWCADLWGSYSAEAQIDPDGSEVGLNRVYRGGSWAHDAWGVRAACRIRDEPGRRDDRLGFRFSLGRPRSGRGAERGKGLAGAERRSGGSGATS